MFLVDGRFLVLVGDSPDGGRCVPRRLECLLVLVCDRFRRWAVCSSSVGVPPGIGGHISDGSRHGAWGQHTSVAAQSSLRIKVPRITDVMGFL